MFSNPLDADTQARITNLITEIVGKFSTNFPICYTVALVQQIKNEADPPKSVLDECQLEEAPLPSEPLKSGFMTKRGDAHKNWKRRHVVAMNAADNFRIDYFEGEKGKLKGSINCAGYRVEKFNEDDETQYGQFGIKLVPHMKVRRTWYIRCDNEEDRTAWIKTFETCCWKAHAPSDPNPLIATAFNGAFERVRWEYGYWGYYSSYGTEDERLGDFIREILAREIVDAVIGNIPAGFFYSSMVNLVDTTIATSVRVAVSSAWSAVVSGVAAVSATIESTAKSSLGPILEQQVKIKNQITDAISAKTTPFMQEWGGKLFKPVLRGVVGVVSRSFAESIRAVHKVLKEKLADDSLGEGKREQTLNYLDWSGDWWWSGPLDQPKRLVWDMYSDAPAEIFYAGGFSLWSMRYYVIDHLEALFHRAIYTFRKLIKENPGVALATHAAEILRKYVHDAKVFVRYVLLNLLKKLLDSPVNELLIKPAKELVAPIQAVIDAIPIPGLSTLFDLQQLLGEVVSSVCDSGIAACFEDFLQEVFTHVEAVTPELTF
jgi:hypothetical protein